MKKIFSLMLLLIGVSVLATSAFATGNNLFVNGVEKGQYTDLNIVNACGQTARTGMKGIVDAACAKQTSASSTAAAQTIIQTSTLDGATLPNFPGTPAAIGLTCTQDTSGISTCADYSTSNSTKVGSIAVTVNGTVLFLRTYNGPQ